MPRLLPRLPALAALLLVAAAATGAAQDPSVPMAPRGTAPPPERARTLGLSLDNLSGPSPGRFSLFSDYWYPDTEVAMYGPPTLWGGALTTTPVTRLTLRGPGLAMRFGEKVDAEGRKQLVLVPLYRDWDDLSGWEKLGLTLQVAGTAAAIGHFIGKAF